MTAIFWTVVRLPISGRHYDPQEVVTDGLLHVSREEAIAHLQFELTETYGDMGYAVNLGNKSGHYSFGENADGCLRTDGDDSTFLSFPDFECCYLIARLSSLS